MVMGRGLRDIISSKERSILHFKRHWTPLDHKFGVAFEYIMYNIKMSTLTLLFEWILRYFQLKFD